MLINEVLQLTLHTLTIHVSQVKQSGDFQQDTLHRKDLHPVPRPAQAMPITP